MLLNEADYNRQLQNYNLMSYMGVATAQPDKKGAYKVRSAAKKLKPKYMFDYDYVSDESVKGDLEELHKFVEKRKETDSSQN